jgi:hypothetical protein
MNWSKTAFRTSFFPNPTWTVSRGSIGLNAARFIWSGKRDAEEPFQASTAVSASESDASDAR